MEKMESFKASGVYTKQAHVRIPEGTFEEEHGRQGFFGRVSQLYHANPLTSWEHIEGELKPRSLPSVFNEEALQNHFSVFLSNADISVSLGTFTKAPEFFSRNADGDECFFLHRGEGLFETSYGKIPVKKGDYCIIPRGTTYKYYPKEETRFLNIESSSEFEQPSRGILGPNALYDQTAIFVPEASTGSEQGLERYDVHVKRLGKITRVSYPFNPLDVKGWKGSLYPWRISIYDYCPIHSHRYHIPPSGHTMFVCKNFVMCSFVARPLEHSEHKVLKVPFYHNNIDYDEVLFYHEGDFFSRDNIEAGALTFHPQGIHHGPHPKAFEKANDKTFTEEYAVMIDTRYPLEQSSHWKELENKDYWKSWKES